MLLRADQLMRHRLLLALLLVLLNLEYFVRLP
jgi:hypothetical protein